VDSGFCLLDDGQILACLELALHDSDANGVSGVGVAGLGGGDIAGFGVDEMVMYWEIQVAANCGDGSVDAGEECDDGNSTPADGCEPGCVLTLGILDPSYGIDGIAPGSEANQANDRNMYLDLRADGSALVAYNTYDGSQTLIRIGVTRHAADGSVDAGFVPSAQRGVAARLVCTSCAGLGQLTVKARSRVALAQVEWRGVQTKPK